MLNKSVAIRLITIFFLLVSAPLVSGASQDTLPLLPAPLLFTATVMEGRFQSAPFLVYADPDGAGFRTFYADPELDRRGGLRALKWSPQGDMLAIYRSQLLDPNRSMTILGYSEDICLLDHFGTLVRCFSERPASSSTIDLLDPLNNVTWSADGRFLYYASVTEDFSQLRVVEMEVASGRLRRTLYASPRRSAMPALGWSADARFLIEGGNEDTFLGPLQVTDLSARQTTRLETAQAAAGAQMLCPSFSPSERYLVSYPIRSWQEDEAGFRILDRQGQLVHDIDLTAWLGGRQPTCPTWTADEQTLYFFGQSEPNRAPTLVSYTLATGQGEVLYPFETPVPAYGAIQLSPQGDTLLFDVMSRVRSPHASIGVFNLQDKTLTEIIGPYATARFGIWSVPLPELTPTTMP